VSHSATIGRRGQGDFQGIEFQINHEALDGVAPRFLDAAAALLESVRSVFVDGLFDWNSRGESRPLLQVDYHPTHTLGPAMLNVSFVRVPGLPAFPERFVALFRRIEGEVRRQILQHGGGKDLFVPRAFIESLSYS